jgi:4-diphosphocytidyl-2-C-methyl-D-erythritol kinase
MLTQAAPAKLNLSLAVTGRRADGFHELVSLVASVQLFDRLDFSPGGPWRLTCDDPALPVDGTNLVLKAAEAFRRHRPEVASGHFHLRKLIPSGAGLGGGSSDAAAALRALDLSLEDNHLGLEGLEAIAAEVGSDCPYFVRGITAVMRGRGERLEPVPDASRQALFGRRVLIAKPPFGIPTPEAYGLLIKSGRYAVPSAAEADLSAWMREPSRDPSTLGNTLEAPVFSKYLALPTALEAVAQTHGVNFRMTGSGSACFAFPGEGVDPEAVRGTLVRYWGPGTWFCDTRLSW